MKVIIIDDCKKCPHRNKGLLNESGERWFKCLHPDVVTHEGAYKHPDIVWTPLSICPLPDFKPTTTN